MKGKIKVAALILCGLLLSPLIVLAENAGRITVAEPSTMILLGVGLIGISFIGRRSLKK